MGIREISENITAFIQQGKSRQDIFDQLVKSAPAEAGKIAYCIASVPEEQVRKKYLYFNASLCVLLVIYSILNMVSGLPIEPDEPTLFLLITTVIPLIFCYFVFRFHGGIYRLSGLWFLIDLSETLILASSSDSLSALKVMALCTIVFLSFFIGRKVFPGMGFVGPRKDKSGNYIL